MMIFIPSMGRWKKSTTLESLAPGLVKGQHRIFFVVPSEETEDYKNLIGPYREVAEVVGATCKGIALTRQLCAKLAVVMGERKFVMFDDDLIFSKRPAPNARRLVPINPVEDGPRILEDIEEGLEYYDHLSISIRPLNNRIEEFPYQENTRLLRVLAYKTDSFLACEHGRVPVMEDFDVTLQMLERGLPNANLVYWAQDQAGTQAAGGCSTYRTHDMQEAAAKELQRLHPEVVRLKQKANKTGGEFGTRTDVTIQWKKAFKA